MESRRLRLTTFFLMNSLADSGKLGHLTASVAFIFATLMGVLKSCVRVWMNLSWMSAWAWVDSTTAFFDGLLDRIEDDVTAHLC